MASDSRKSGIPQGPSLLAIIFGALASLVVGVALGAAHLVFKPVEKVKELPKDAYVGPAIYRPVYFIEGSSYAKKSPQVTRKRQMLGGKESAEITFSEDELNAFAASVVPPPPPPAPAPKPAAKPPAAAAAKPAPPTAEIATLPPGSVNFRIRDGVLQVALPENISLAGLVDLSVLVQMRGDFTTGASGPVFQPAEFYLGSLPLHKIPGSSSWLLNRILAAQKSVPEDLRTAWSRVSDVAVKDTTLNLTLP